MASSTDKSQVKTTTHLREKNKPASDKEKRKSKVNLSIFKRKEKGAPAVYNALTAGGDRLSSITKIIETQTSQTTQSWKSYTPEYEIGRFEIVDSSGENDSLSSADVTVPNGTLIESDAGSSTDISRTPHTGKTRGLFNSLKAKVGSLKDKSSSPKSPKTIVSFAPEIMDNEGKTDQNMLRRNSHGFEFEADDEGFCIDGFLEDEDDLDSSDEEDYSEDEIDGTFYRKLSDSVSPQQTVITDEAKALKQKTTEESRTIPKYQRIAQEIMTTEETYVKRLRLINESAQEFLDNSILTKDQCDQIFKNLNELYTFHGEEFLPKIKTRIEHWEEDPRIGDLMKRMCPFLKLYTPFIKNIEHGRKLIHQHKKASTKFSSALQRIENSSQANKITLSDYMTEPMTRLLRYKLLLGEYLRKLPEEHVDRDDTEAALDITSDAAKHVNESMRAEDNMARLVQIQDSLAEFTVVEQQRVFLKEGRMALVDCPRGRHLERHIFLFNNLLLICQPQIMGMKYRVLMNVPMKHIVLHRDEDKHHFTVRTRNIVAEFYGSTHRETEEWVKAIDDALTSYRKDNPVDDTIVSENVEDELGYLAPQLERRNSSQKCNLCGLPFVSIRRTKNHCFACGKIFCARCTNQTVPLAYQNWQSRRVCNRCYSSLYDDAVCKSIENLSESAWEVHEPRPVPKPRSKKKNLSTTRKSLPLESVEILEPFD